MITDEQRARGVTNGAWSARQARVIAEILPAHRFTEPDHTECQPPNLCPECFLLWLEAVVEAKS